MATAPEPITCKSCARTIATISSDDVPYGLIPAPITVNALGCLSCLQFNVLFNNVQAAHEKYTEVQTRRDNYRPKKYALAKARETRKELGNWLNSNDRADYRTEIVSTADDHEENPAPQDSQQQQGTKRPRSQSPELKIRSPLTSTDGLRRTASQSERRRLKFADTVEFRDSYRPNNKFQRTDRTTYEKGRYAPPDGSTYLDTSGNRKTYRRFTGYKMIGGQWVDVWKDEDDEENITKKHSRNGNGLDFQDDSALEDDEVQDENTPRSARSERRARRNSRIAKTGQASGTSRTRSLRSTRGGGALNRDKNEVEEPLQITDPGSEPTTSDARYKAKNPSHAADALIYTEHFLPLRVPLTQTSTAEPGLSGDKTDPAKDVGSALGGGSDCKAEGERSGTTLNDTTTSDQISNQNVGRELEPGSAKVPTTVSTLDGSTAQSSLKSNTSNSITEARQSKDLPARLTECEAPLASAEAAQLPSMSINEIGEVQAKVSYGAVANKEKVG
jgi:hypothetical protein